MVIHSATRIGDIEEVGIACVRLGVDVRGSALALISVVFILCLMTVFVVSDYFRLLHLHRLLLSLLWSLGALSCLHLCKVLRFLNLIN